MAAVGGILDGGLFVVGVFVIDYVGLGGDVIGWDMKP